MNIISRNQPFFTVILFILLWGGQGYAQAQLWDLQMNIKNWSKWESPTGKTNRYRSFTFQTLFTQDTVYDSNVYAEQLLELDDIYTRTDIGVQAESDWGKHHLELFAGADLYRYASVINENREEFLIGGRGEIDILKRWKIPVYLQKSRRHQQRNENISRFFTLQPLEINEEEAEIGLVYKPGRLKLSTFLGHLRTRFDNGVSITDPNLLIVREDDDNDLTRIQLNTVYDVSEVSNVFSELTIAKTKYKGPVFNDSLRVFTDFNRDNTSYLAALGYERKIPDVYDVRVEAGVQNFDFEERRLNDRTNFYFNSIGNIHLTGLTNLTFRAGRRQEQENELQESLLLNTFDLGLDHELTRHTQLFSGFGYRFREVDELNREDELFTIGAQVEHKFSEKFSIGAGAAYFEQISNDSNAEFDKYLFILRGRYLY